MALVQRCAAAARTLACAAPFQCCAASLLEAPTRTSAAPLVLLPALLHPRASFGSGAALREVPGDAASQPPRTVSAAAPATLPAQLQARARFCSGAAVREVPAEGAGQLSFAARPAQAGQQAVYMVDIITGDVRGAGTEARQLLFPALASLAGRGGLRFWHWFASLSEGKASCSDVQAPAVIRLIGSEGQSEEYVLGTRPALLPLAKRWPHAACPAAGSPLCWSACVS